MKNRNLFRDLLALWISITALMCAVLNMHVQRNLHGKR